MDLNLLQDRSNYFGLRRVNPFQFQTANRIESGAGAGARLPEFVAELFFETPTAPRRCLFVTGKNPDRTRAARQRLEQAGVLCTVVSIAGEPGVADARAGVELARDARCDFVVAIGGGSALDAGKTIAALATNSGDPFEYLEVVGAGRPLVRRGLPLIAIPTTAGTGSEVTRNAVLASPEHQVKVSLRSPLLLPALAIVDPLLTLSLSPDVTADCGLDALTQVIEPLVSIRANPLTDALAREGIRRSARSLLRAFHEPADVAARTDLCFTSLVGGLALANAGLGAVHGFAGPLGGMFPIPHGAVCARLLPYVIETNTAVLEGDTNGSRIAPELRETYLRRFQEVAALLTGRPNATIAAGVDFIFELCANLAIKPLREFGVRPEDFGRIVTASKKSSSMRGNCVELSDQELTEIIERAL